MWRNTVVFEFLEWLRERNARSPEPAGFYGLDLYSLHASIEAVLRHLDEADPEAARRARARFGCFERFGGEQDGQSYGYATALGQAEPCEDEVVAQLVELRPRAAKLVSRDGRLAADRRVAARQNAR